MSMGSPEQKRRVSDSSTGGLWRLSINLNLAKKRHEKHRKRILSEHLNEAPKKGEAREAHRPSRLQAGQGMGSRRRNFAV